VYDLIIRDSTIIQPGGRRVADIAITDGRLAYVGDRPGGGAREVIEGIGRFVMPGVIDTQVTLSGDSADWRAVSRAALASGTTSLLELPGPGAALDSQQRLRERHQAAATGHVDHGFWAAATDASGEEVLAALRAGLAAAPLVRLEHEGDSAGLSGEGLHALLEAWPGRVGFDSGASAGAAAEGMRQVLDLARETDHPLHICSISTARELGLLAPTGGDAPVTTAVTLPHLMLSDARARGASITVYPPLRTETDRRSLWALLKRGRIDAVASGHASPGAQTGLPGVDTLLRLLLAAVGQGRMSLERLVQMCCAAPADLLGIAGKGEIREGYDADLLLFTEGQTARLKAPPRYARQTPYIGREVGRPPAVVVAGGRVVARDGVLEDDLPAGRPLRYRRPTVSA